MTDPPATVRTVCPHCRALLAVAAEFAGRPVACGRCRKAFPAEPAAQTDQEPRLQEPRPRGSGWTGQDAIAGSSRSLAVAAPRGHGPYRRPDDDFDDRPRRRADGAATASLVLGIVSLVFFCVFPVSLTTGAIGAWLGVTGLKSRSRPLAVTGLTLSAVGIVFGLGFAVLFLAGVVKAVNDQPRLGPARNNPTFHAR